MENENAWVASFVGGTGASRKLSILKQIVGPKTTVKNHTVQYISAVPLSVIEKGKESDTQRAIFEKFLFSQMLEVFACRMS